MARTRKRIAVCMDGTWQKLNQERPTNIAVIARSVAHQDTGGVQQIVVYSQGVGATQELQPSVMTQVSGGAFGAGLEQSIMDTYLRVCFNYEPGDEIYIFGFSRGAFSARSLAAMIGKVGIVSRRFAEKVPEGFKLYQNRPRLDPRTATPAQKAAKTAYDERFTQFRRDYGKKLRGPGTEDSDHRPQVTYLAVFDTVGQRGLPSAFGWFSDIFNGKYAFHDTDLALHVRAARHAVAIDERRWPFPPTAWTNLDAMNSRAAKEAVERGEPAPEEPLYQQRWFPGTHGDIGGGAASNLSAFPLNWVVQGAESLGLRFDRGEGSVLDQALEGLDPLAPLTIPTAWDHVNPMNWGLSARRIRRFARKETAPVDLAAADLHPVTALRVAETAAERKPYRPAPLKRYLEALDAIAANRAALQRLAGLKPRPDGDVA